MPSSSDAATGPQLARDLQQQLKRVGCDPGAVDGTWGAKARNALSRFAAAIKKDLTLDSLTEVALQALRNKSGRVCPLLCEDDEVVSGDRCVPKQKPAGQSCQSMRAELNKINSQAAQIERATQGKTTSASNALADRYKQLLSLCLGARCHG